MVLTRKSEDPQRVVGCRKESELWMVYMKQFTNFWASILENWAVWAGQCQDLNELNRFQHVQGISITHIEQVIILNYYLL